MLCRTLVQWYELRDKIDPIALKDIDESNGWLTGGTEEDAQDEFVFEEDEGLTWGHVAIAAGVHEERINLRSRGRTQEGRDAGNVVVLKPSEIASATSSLLASRALVQRYELLDKTNPIALKYIDESNEWLIGRTEEDAQNEFVFEKDEGFFLTFKRFEYDQHAFFGAIATGIDVVLKPSEIAPATSSLLARMAADYLGGSCIKVVEGVVPEMSALLEQKWDKILYTCP
ncbi:hypothetical protein V6N13_072845 [Hibiscus sabdariffa]